MDILSYTLLGNSLRAWAIAAAISLGAYIVLDLLRRLLSRNLRRFASWTSGDFDDLIVELIQNTGIFFLAVLAVYAASRLLVLSARAETAFGWILITAVVYQAGRWGNQVISYFIRAHLRRVGEDPLAETTLQGLAFIGRLLLWAVLVLLALNNMGVQITALVTGLGIGGVAIALAVQKILGDLFASLSIVLDKPFVLGDFIIVDDLMGTVEHIGMKTTRLRSLSGEQLVFGNTDLLSSRIRNYKRMSERRALFGFGVVYQTPREKLEKIPQMVHDIIGSVENTRLDRAHFKGFGDSSLDFEVVYYMLVPDYNAYMDAQQEINLRLYSCFEEQGIEFAYPTRTLFISGDAVADGAEEVRRASAAKG